MGLHRAFPGAEIVGVDIEPQPHYPFTFVLGDALIYSLEWFDLIWASPPCQAYTNQGRNGKHPKLIAKTRERIDSHPYIIENVVGAPLRNPVMLCSSMFDLGVRRHRNFETNFDVFVDRDCSHSGRESACILRILGKRSISRKETGKQRHAARHARSSGTGYGHRVDELE